MRYLTRWAPSVQTVLAALAIAATMVLFELLFGREGALLAAVASGAATRGLKQIYGEAKEIQDKYRGKPMPEDEAKKFEDLCAEGKAVQDELDRDARIREMQEAERKGAQIVDDVLPNPTPAPETKGASQVVGYATVGQLYVESAEYKEFVAKGMLKVPVAAVMEHKDLRNAVVTPNGIYVPVTREMVERKAIADPGSLLQPDRLTAEIQRSEERRRTFLRGVINQSQTTLSSVEYYIYSYTDAAANTAPSAQKPEAAITVTDASAPVRDIPVTMPIREQTLEDAPQLQNLIDGEMRRDIEAAEERGQLWGGGSGAEFLGIFNTPGVNAMARVRAGATLLDKIRMARTDVTVAEVEPNFIALHPYDWEDVELSKGSDNRYVFVVVTDPTGANRIWRLAVVETQAMQKPTLAVNTNTIYERRALIGDGMRGATVWDRSQVQVALGWVNDQFRTNERTIRAEKRAAFAVRRPYAFRYVVTQAEAA